MATIKSFSDLRQSKKLAEILPLESADMRYDEYISYIDGTPKVGYKKGVTDDIPCWSLAALLDVLNKSAYFANEAGMVELSSIKSTKWCVSMLNCGKIKDCYAGNPVDACYEMIIKLNELKML